MILQPGEFVAAVGLPVGYPVVHLNAISERGTTEESSHDATIVSYTSNSFIFFNDCVPSNIQPSHDHV